MTGKGAIRHREFVMASGEISQQAFTEFLTTVFRRLVKYTTTGSIHFTFMDWRHIIEIMAAGKEVYTEFKNLCVWTKTNAGMGTFYRSQHELVFVWKSGEAPHLNNFQLGQHGRNRSNVWHHAGVNTMRPGRLEELAIHPTVKPVALVADAIKDCSRRGELVLNSFCGSGTILIAAERTGRKARTLEIDPQYVDVAVRRWQKYTGKAATLAATGQTFEDVEEVRIPNTSPTNSFEQRGTSSAGGCSNGGESAKREGRRKDRGFDASPDGETGRPRGRCKSCSLPRQSISCRCVAISWRSFTGKAAKLASANQSFKGVEEQRGLAACHLTGHWTNGCPHSGR